MIRAIIYELKDGKLTEDAAKKLRLDLGKRLTDAIRGPATKDSPLFQLIGRCFNTNKEVKLSDRGNRYRAVF